MLGIGMLRLEKLQRGRPTALLGGDAADPMATALPS